MWNLSKSISNPSLIHQRISAGVSKRVRTNIQRIRARLACHHRILGAVGTDWYLPNWTERAALWSSDHPFARLLYFALLERRIAHSRVNGLRRHSDVMFLGSAINTTRMRMHYLHPLFPAPDGHLSALFGGTAVLTFYFTRFCFHAGDACGLKVGVSPGPAFGRITAQTIFSTG